MPSAEDRENMIAAEERFDAGVFEWRSAYQSLIDEMGNSPETPASSEPERATDVAESPSHVDWDAELRRLRERNLPDRALDVELWGTVSPAYVEAAYEAPTREPLPAPEPAPTMGEITTTRRSPWLEYTTTLRAPKKKRRARMFTEKQINEVASIIRKTLVPNRIADEKIFNAQCNLYFTMIDQFSYYFSSNQRGRFNPQEFADKCGRKHMVKLQNRMFDGQSPLDRERPLP
jgi:hypothetical protein